jgi:hypothetical protein
MKRTCNLCGCMMTGGIQGFEQHGIDHHPDYFLTKKIKFVRKKYFCPLDQQWYSDRKHLVRAINKAGWDHERYYISYGEQYMKEEWESNHSHPTLGDAYNRDTCLECNKKVQFSAGWYYPAFCSLSCSTTWHAKNTNRVDIAQKTLRERKAKDPNLQLRPNQLQYWINRGFTEEEAREKVRQRQQTTKLERFIERYGEEKGRDRWASRQEKWMSGLKESGMFSGYSAKSRKLFTELDRIKPRLLFAENEKAFKCGTQVITVDCYDPSTNKVIEFYGNYWHANPETYKADDIIRTTGRSAKEIWDRDLVRIRLLAEKGIKVMVVWESEYNQNPQLVVGKCIGWFHE